MLIQNIVHVIGLQILIKNASRIDNHDWAMGAEADTSGLDQHDFILNPPAFDGFNQAMLDLHAFGCTAAGAATEHQVIGICRFFGWNVVHETDRHETAHFRSKCVQTFRS